MLTARAVVATVISLSTVAPSRSRQSRLSRQGSSDLAGVFLEPKTTVFCRQSRKGLSTVAKFAIVATLSRQAVDNSSTNCPKAMTHYR